jgi:uncharacterized membrane-anchored protein
MSTDKNLVQAAQAEGLLPSAATQTLHDPSPSWIITVLTLVGAQFAVWPLMIVLGFSAGEFLIRPPQSFIFSGLLIAGAVIGLRSQLNLFLTHLCFTLLLVGFGLVTASMLFTLKAELWSLMLLLILQVGAAMLVRIGWVQRILGFGAALTFMLIPPELILSSEFRASRMMMMFPLLLNALLLAALWVAWCIYEARMSGYSIARNLGAFFEGVVVALLCAQIYAARGYFLFSDAMRAGSADDPTAGMAVMFAINRFTLLQLAITVASWWWLTQHWRLRNADQRRTWATLTLVYLCLAVFGFFTRDGGIVVLVGTAALATGRMRMVVLTLLVLLTQLSSFYYALAWPLAHKALLLVIVGVFLAVFLWALRRQFSIASDAKALQAGAASSAPRKGALILGLIAAGGIFSLGAANYDVMKKEQVIQGGQKIYIALVPRDPRSLMQGDYMALNFAFASTLNGLLGRSNEDNDLLARATVVAKLDERDIATVLRAADTDSPNKEVLAAGEILLPVIKKQGNWVLVTDAFFFPEGRGEPFKAAKFGEFRALPDGRALLVGLADDNLVSITPSANKRRTPDLEP